MDTKPGLPPGGFVQRVAQSNPRTIFQRLVVESWWSVWERGALNLHMQNCCQFVWNGENEACLQPWLACLVEDENVFGRFFRLFQNLMVP